jgi:hypothetical protein
VLEDMKKYVRAGLEALSSPGAEDAAGAFMDKAGGLAEQFSAFASGFLEWSAEARASLLQELRDMITRQVESMGLATKDDVETLRRRLDRLEAGGARPKASASAGRKTGAKAAPRKASSPAKRATARRSTTARRSSRSSPSTRSRASRPPASE